MNMNHKQKIAKKSQAPAPTPGRTIDDLVEALNNMRDAWTKASIELHDIQFDLDSQQRQQAAQSALDNVHEVKPH